MSIQDIKKLTEELSLEDRNEVLEFVWTLVKGGPPPKYEDPLDFCECKHNRSEHSGDWTSCTGKDDKGEECSCLEFREESDWEKLFPPIEEEKPVWITGEILSCCVAECYCDCHSGPGVDCNTHFLEGAPCWEGKVIERLLDYFGKTKDSPGVFWSWQFLRITSGVRKLEFRVNGDRREVECARLEVRPDVSVDLDDLGYFREWLQG